MKGLIAAILIVGSEFGYAACGPEDFLGSWGFQTQDDSRSQSGRLTLSEGEAVLKVGVTAHVDSGHGSGPIVAAHEFAGTYELNDCQITLEFTQPVRRTSTAVIENGELVVTGGEFIQVGTTFKKAVTE